MMQQNQHQHPLLGSERSQMRGSGCSNFFDAVLECMDAVNAAEADPSVSKQDAIDGIRARLSVMASAVLSGAVTGSCYTMQGWRVEAPAGADGAS